MTPLLEKLQADLELAGKATQEKLTAFQYRVYGGEDADNYVAEFKEMADAKFFCHADTHFERNTKALIADLP
jgi:hypothetical protein